jgi:hypothetical protein
MMSITESLTFFGSLFGILVAFKALFGKNLNDAMSTHNTIKKSLKALLKNGILKSARDYLQRGSISEEELETVLEMYTNYCALGGNSFVEKLICDCKALPIKKYN